MKTPPDPRHTDIFTPPPKNPGARPALAAPDLCDQDQVFDLAHACQNADDRRLMRVTLAQQRAIARLAVRAATIGSHAVEFIDALECGDKARIQAAQDALQQVVKNP